MLIAKNYDAPVMNLLSGPANLASWIYQRN